MTANAPQMPDTGTLTAATIKVPKAPTEQDVDDSTPESRKALVNSWGERIKAARDFWQPSFERMRDNMKFAAGNQWAGDESKNSFGLKKYVANIVNRQCSLKVASLYAKNPEVSAKRRPKMDFSVWDGTQKQLMAAQQQIAQAMPVAAAHVQAGAIPPSPPPMAAAILQDYAAGMQKKKLFDKLADTLEMVFEFQMQNQKPCFKTQMKSMVLRAVTTNVGYLKIAYRRDTETMPTSSTTIEGFVERLKRLVTTAQQLQEDNVDPDSPMVADLKLQAQELAQAAQSGEVQQTLREGLVFDFPPSTAVLVDPQCRCLEDFVSAEWVCQEFIMSPDQIQAQWGIDVRGSSVKQYIEGTVKDASGKADGSLLTAAARAVKKFFGVWDAKAKACVWEIYDKTGQQKLVVCDGWPDFLEEPAAPEPQISGFYPIFAFVKNRIEVEDNLPKEGVTCYGESDVQLMRSQQEEKNRSREALRLHRIHNKDRYLYPQGGLTSTEMGNIANGGSGAFIPIAALAAGKTVSEICAPLPVQPIDKAVYDDAWVMQDVMLTVGTQDADLGNAPSGQTATGQSIAQSQRNTSIGSDIDSLDDFLCKMARAGGEMILTEMQQDEINRICGAGAAQLPMLQSDREAIKDELYLEVEAASTGKPNKAMDVQNFVSIAPQLQNLWQIMGLDPTVLLKYGIKVADMKIDLDELIDEARMQAQGGGGQGKNQIPEKMSLSLSGKDLAPEEVDQAVQMFGIKPAPPASRIITKIGHKEAAAHTIPQIQTAKPQPK